MEITLDHFFILTEPGAPAAGLVSGIGLKEGTCNRHPGQGTANRRFFCKNSTFEFLYLQHPDEAKNGNGKRLRLLQRHSDPRASPFGLIVRKTPGNTVAPFPGWRYCPEYFGENQCFHVGANSELLAEPLCICMPDNLHRPNNPSQTDNAGWNLTELRISTPISDPSLPLATLAKCDGVSLRLNEPHQLELVFNAGKSGREADFSAQCPLIIYW